MTTLMKRFVCATAFSLFAISGFSQKSPGADKVLFTVDKQPTNTSEFLYLFRKNNQGKDGEQTEAKIREYLDLVVNFKLKVAEAHLRGVDTTQSFIKEFTQYRDELKKPFVASNNEMDRLVREAYDRMKEEVQAAHILISIPSAGTPADTLDAWNKIQSIRERIVRGEDFGKLAGELSDDPSAKQNSGMLGYFSAMAMVYQFEDAAFKTKPGEVSQPVRTRFGYHLIKVYDRRPASGEVEVSHILLGGTDDKTRNKAFEIFDQLKAGMGWDELCRENSMDTNTKDRGGKLPPFTLGSLPAVPEFEAMAFSLSKPGEISDPFKSNLGWHIIKLERRIGVPSFEEAEPMLKRRIGRDERLQISQGAQLRRRKLQMGIIDNRELKLQLEAAADTSLQRGNWNMTTVQTLAQQPMFRLNSRIVPVSDFLKYVKEHQRPSALPPAAYLNQLYDGFVETLLSDEEDRNLQNTNDEYKNLVREYREGIMFFSIMEKEVWNLGSADTVGQRAYYDAHKDKYQAGDRVYARVYSTSDKMFLQQVKEKATRGDSLTGPDLRKFKSVTSFRAFGKGENKVVDMVPWAVGLHEAEADGMYYLVEIERLVPPGLKTFQEARANVISDFQEEIEKKWIASLKEKHPVKVNKKAVKAVIQQLQKK